jgi:drug/metabolite transporter (DMT)-like permease
MFSKRALAIVVGITMSFLYGLMSVFSRWLNLGFGPITQVYLRVFGAAILGSLVFSRQINWRKFMTLSLGEWLMLLLMGVGGYGLMVFAITKGALLTSLLNVSVVFSTVPFFVYFLGLIFFHKQLNWKIIILLIISVWGVGILASGRLVPNLSQFGIGDWWVLLSTLMEAIWFIGIKVLGNKLNGRELGASAQFIAGTSLLIVSLLIGEAAPSLPSLAIPLVLVGLLGGILVNIVTPIMSVFMFKNLDEVFATQLLLFENVFSLFIGWMFYHEVRSPMQLLGATAVVLSVYLMNKLQTT